MAGTWSDDDTLVLGASFGDVIVLGRNLVIEDIDLATAHRQQDGHWLIGYADQDVTIHSTREVEVEQSGWTLDLDQGADLASPFDDIVVANGAMQAVERDGRASQTTLTEVRMDAGCLLNPLGGGGGYQSVDPSDSTKTELTGLRFSSPCDGRAEVFLTIGTGIASLGQRIELDLLARD